MRSSQRGGQFPPLSREGKTMHSPCVRVAQHCALAVIALLSLVASPPAFGVDTLYWTNSTSNKLSFFALDASNAGDIAVSGTTVASPTGIALDPVAHKVYWANYSSGISFANLDGSAGGTLNVTGATVNNASGLALDVTAGRIYWANRIGKISYTNLNGLGGGDLNTSGTSSGDFYGVALDHAAGRIYWTNFSANKISYANLNGSGGADLNTGAATLSVPTGVAIDPIGNKIYWANTGVGSAKISYASLSGSGGGDLTTTGASFDFPIGVAIDPALGKLFWTDYVLKKISYANLDGSGSAEIAIAGATVDRPGFLALLPYAISFGDPISHNGFEACWSKAITKPDFLDTLQSAIDNVTSCIPQSSGVGYTACSLPKCPNNAIGCPVTTHAGPFSGAFAAGIGNQYTSTGSTNDVVIDIAYTGGSCTITASTIALDYALDYKLAIDGNSGLNVVSLDQSTLTVHNGYMLTGSNPVCQTIASTAGATLVSEIETDGAAGIAALEAPATVGQSVCPLTP